MGVFADYGAGEKAEMELRDSHHEDELFINAVPSILIGLDSQGRIKRWNGAAAQAFGLEGAEVLVRIILTGNCGPGDGDQRAQRGQHLPLSGHALRS